MPYIPAERRRALEYGRDEFPVTPGELNYAITRLCAAYTRRRTLNYTTVNDVLGALEGAKLEFYRRVAVPYENSKRGENGDVYD